MTENRPMAMNERIEIAEHVFDSRLQRADACFINACLAALDGPASKVAEAVHEARRERIEANDLAQRDHASIMRNIAPHLSPR